MSLKPLLISPLKHANIPNDCRQVAFQGILTGAQL